ncbi:helix-turn-helix domain-containing protein [Providencia sp. Je.9.19]|uniref:helix-turn-helix domain-containing protein n=1 Tax=Providencia sp. Je.9.19 TaxID=3142844 RepID=UPI003DA93E51
MKKFEFENEELNYLIGMKIKKLRKLKGLTGQQLSEVFNISQQQISRYERGINGVNINFLSKLSFFFKVPIDFFLKEDERNQS